jgi:hypothetical protein
VPVNEQEIARLMAIKGALNATKSTQGWHFIRQIADNISKQATEAALDEDDKQKGEDKRLIAKAARDAFKTLWQAVENAAAIDADVLAESELGNLERE